MKRIRLLLRPSARAHRSGAAPARPFADDGGDAARGSAVDRARQLCEFPVAARGRRRRRHQRHARDSGAALRGTERSDEAPHRGAAHAADRAGDVGDVGESRAAAARRRRLAIQRSALCARSRQARRSDRPPLRWRPDRDGTPRRDAAAAVHRPTGAARERSRVVPDRLRRRPARSRRRRPACTSRKRSSTRSRSEIRSCASRCTSASARSSR